MAQVVWRQLKLVQDSVVDERWSATIGRWECELSRRSGQWTSDAYFETISSNAIHWVFWLRSETLLNAQEEFLSRMRETLAEASEGFSQVEDLPEDGPRLSALGVGPSRWFGGSGLMAVEWVREGGNWKATVGPWFCRMWRQGGHWQCSIFVTETASWTIYLRALKREEAKAEVVVRLREVLDLVINGLSEDPTGPRLSVWDRLVADDS